MYRSAVQNGVTWECPNIFVIDGKFGLLYSPCGAVEYAIGTLDESYRLIPEHTGLIDPAAWQGFYAPQTFVDERGRQILLGWMPECDGTYAELACGWSGAMSLPRLMTLDDDGDLHITPLPEALAIATEWQAQQLSAGEHTLSGNAAHSFLRISGTITQPLTITMQTGDDEYSAITLTPDGTLTLDRSHSCADGQPNVSDITRCVPISGGRIDLFAAFDDTTIECCVNGRWLSGRVYPAGNAAALRVSCGNPLEINLCDRLKTVNEGF
jgi:beta-fructofuranosidase